MPRPSGSGFSNGDLPGLIVEIEPPGSHFSADLHHVATKPEIVERLGDLIYTVALGNRRQVAVDLRMLLAERTGFGVDFDQVIPHTFTQGGNSSSEGPSIGRGSGPKP